MHTNALFKRQREKKKEKEESCIISGAMKMTRRWNRFEPKQNKQKLKVINFLDSHVTPYVTFSVCYSDTWHTAEKVSVKDFSSSKFSIFLPNWYKLLHFSPLVSIFPSSNVLNLVSNILNLEEKNEETNIALISPRSHTFKAPYLNHSLTYNNFLLVFS